MRAWFSILILFLAVFLFLKFYPDSEVEGAPPSGEAPAPAAEPSQARFLERPRLQEPPLQEPEPLVQAPTIQAPVQAPAQEAAPEWLEEAERLGSAERSEVELAEAILHGTPQRVSALLDRTEGIGVDRRTLILAFVEALAGRSETAVQWARDIDWSQVADEEERLLRLALQADVEEVRAVEAASREAPVTLAMGVALEAMRAGAFLAERRYPEAAQAFSRALIHDLGAPWTEGREKRNAWAQGLETAQEHYRWSPRGSWPSVEMTVEPGDSLSTIRARYLAEYPDRLLCTGLIERVNRIRGFIHPGDRLRIPTDPVRVVVDIDKRYVLYLFGDEVAAAWEVGVGRPGEETIVGEFTAGNKLEEPMWFPKGQDPVAYGDPRNPLGTHWIGWFQGGRATSYGLHGTNDPDSIGLAASDGCIRLRNEDVAVLFEILPLDSPISVH